MDTIRLETVEVFTNYKSRYGKLTSVYKKWSEGKLEEEVRAAQLGNKGEGLTKTLEMAARNALQLERELGECANRAADQMKESSKMAFQCAVEAEENTRKAKLIADKLASLAKRDVMRGKSLAERAKQVAENAKKCAEKAKHGAQQVQRDAEGAKDNAEETNAMLSKPVKLALDVQFTNMGMN